MFHDKVEPKFGKQAHPNVKQLGKLCFISCAIDKPSLGSVTSFSYSDRVTRSLTLQSVIFSLTG